MGFEVAKFPHQGFSRDKDPISQAQGIGKDDPEDKELVTSCLSLLFTSAQRGLGQLSPQAPYLLVYHRELWA